MPYCREKSSVAQGQFSGTGGVHGHGRWLRYVRVEWLVHHHRTEPLTLNTGRSTCRDLQCQSLTLLVSWRSCSVSLPRRQSLWRPRLWPPQAPLVKYIASAPAVSFAAPARGVHLASTSGVLCCTAPVVECVTIASAVSENTPAPIAFFRHACSRSARGACA